MILAHSSTSALLCGVCKPIPVAHIRPRRACVHVTCRQTVKKAASGRKQSPGKGRKAGFGQPDPRQQQEPWEKELIPQYRIYYKPGYKPIRFRGPIDLRRTPSGRCSAVLEEAISPAQLLFISHPLFLVEGSLSSTPGVEDLHAQLLENPPAPAEAHVLTVLPTRPALKLNRPTPPAGSAAAAAAAAAATAAAANLDGLTSPVVTNIEPSSTDSSSSSSSSGAPGEDAASPTTTSASSSTAAEEEAASSIPWEQLNAGLWRALGAGPPEPLGSGALMRTLQLSSWAEEYRDPGASQVRHELPSGFLGVWPEHAYLEHSCCPNTSAIVVGRYMYMHSVDELQAGTALTTNKLGADVMAPLGVRTAASLKLFGRTCSCKRCQTEARLPEAAAQRLKGAWEAAQGAWPEALEAAAEEEDVDALAELQATMTAELGLLEEALAAAGLDEEQQLLVRAGAYNAYDLLWQLEEVLAQEPGLWLLEDAIDLLQVFSPGSADHAYACMVLNDAYLARMQPLVKEIMSIDGRRRPSRVKILQRKLEELREPAELAETKFLAAMYFRYGYIGQEGLFPQLQQGMALFYQGLAQLGAEQAGGGPRVSELEYDGIPVTVVDSAGVPGTGANGQEASEGLAADAAATGREGAARARAPGKRPAAAAGAGRGKQAVKVSVIESGAKQGPE